MDNRLKQFYEEDATRFWDPKRGMVGRDLSIYPLLHGFSGRVLEYGAGSGSLLLNLALEDRFTSLFGVDISETALENINKSWDEMSSRLATGRDKLRTMTPVGDRLPAIHDKSIDLILSLDTIEHVLDPYTVLDELYRIGADDAVFVISVPNYGYIKHVVKLALGRQPITGGGEPVDNWRESGWDGWHLHTFTKESLNSLLHACGWQPVKWTGYGDKYAVLNGLRKKYPSFWSGALTVVCKKKRGN